MYILGIETSCDETSCAILKNFNVLSNITISSLKEHKKYGGIVPEIASRYHVKNIDKVLDIAIKKAKISLYDIKLVAVSYTPGLIGALAVGVSFAKAIAFSLNIPFIGINHLYAHLFAPFLNLKHRIDFPFLGVVVSGGHTQIYYVKDFDCIETIGQTLDDACGEVFDKVARAFNLGYPGGPIIDRLFNKNYKNSFQFKCGRRGFNLSFSGLKTAVIYKKLELERKRLLNKETKIKLISSFQETVVRTLVNTIKEAADRYGLLQVVCGGGVFANSYLRKSLKIKNKRIFLSPIEYATDNAATVAGLGFYLYNKKGIKSDYNSEPKAG
ncbi:MAG: tRNA (adenosine(37)-N6)-threonylcarbamoyltransferase complex transferase subunit TsaD [Candidatus Omnitrophica bacterium]|nr:tRNA (adenosine(37)-N6)-threonylcarbamoyltransferase complex transferase subunit TsaD [Candidatus Omnitrophota bacterium]